MNFISETSNRVLKIIYIGQASAFIALLVLTLRHFWVSPANHYYLLVFIMILGFIPSLLFLYVPKHYAPYILVSNALLLVVIIFSLLQDWALGGVFILVPVFSLLFKDKQLYIITSVVSLFLNVVLMIVIFYDGGIESEKVVIMLDFLTIFIILVFLIYFVTKDLVDQSTMEMKHMQTIFTLSKSVEAKDLYTQGHSERVAAIGKMISEKIPLLDETSVYYSGLIHDVGKLSIPDSILLKSSPLTEEEFNIMKSHAIEGAKIGESLDIPDLFIKGILHHHERWDGKGYPSSLAGEMIPLIGRILCVADSVDAMLSDRAYRKSLSISDVREELIRCNGNQFDPNIVKIVLDQWDDIEKLYQAK